LKRSLLVIVVVALIALMVAFASVAGANENPLCKTDFCPPETKEDLPPNCEQGIFNAFSSPGAEHRSDAKAQEKLATNFANCGGKL
jgi:hypothetical protein